jgi:hypothetical protein
MSLVYDKYEYNRVINYNFWQQSPLVNNSLKNQFVQYHVANMQKRGELSGVARAALR